MATMQGTILSAHMTLMVQRDDGQKVEVTHVGLPEFTNQQVNLENASLLNPTRVNPQSWNKLFINGCDEAYLNSGLSKNRAQLDAESDMEKLAKAVAADTEISPLAGMGVMMGFQAHG